MKIERLWFLAIAVVLLPLLVGGAFPKTKGSSEVRWDIISLQFPDLRPDGVASARAEDVSKITFTGSGAFVAPAGGGGTSSAATGGGTWETFAPNGTTSTGSGTYEVTGLVRWEDAPGSLP